MQYTIFYELTDLRDCRAESMSYGEQLTNFSFRLNRRLRQLIPQFCPVTTKASFTIF